MEPEVASFGHTWDENGTTEVRFSDNTTRRMTMEEITAYRQRKKEPLVDIDHVDWSICLTSNPPQWYVYFVDGTKKTMTKKAINAYQAELRDQKGVKIKRVFWEKPYMTNPRKYEVRFSNGIECLLNDTEIKELQAHEEKTGRVNG